MSSRLVIFGIDGVPFDLMKRLSDEGIMPNFKRIREDGVFRKMRSSLPEISSVSWSTIFTGKNPGEHGIFGFTELIPGTYSICFTNFHKLKAKPFWHEEPERKHILINIPSTYPASPLNGKMVSGFISPDLERSVYPDDLVDTLHEMHYETDVDAMKGYDSKSAFMAEVFEIHEKRVRLMDHLWNGADWDTFFFVVTGSDRVGHFLYSAIEEQDHDHHDDVMRYFTAVDDSIGGVLERLTPEDHMVLLSDHGMERVYRNVNLNTLLEEKGFLILDGEDRDRYNRIEPGTKAFALDPSRIYLNRKERYPNGMDMDEEQVLTELIEMFDSLEYEGMKVIRSIHRRDEIYHGPCIEDAPDLVLLANTGFSLRGSIGKDVVFEPEPMLTGKHTWDDAFLLVKGADNEDLVPAEPGVEDVVRLLKDLR